MRGLFFASIILVTVILLAQRIEFQDTNQPTTLQTQQSAGNDKVALVLERLSGQVRQVTPTEMLPAPKLDGVLVERLPAKKQPSPPPRSPKPIQWSHPLVISSGVLKSGNRIIKLEGIKPLPLEGMCQDDQGNLWPCGMFARTALRQFVRGRSIACSPSQAVESTILKTRCQLAGFDISAWIVWQGWGTPKDGLFEAELAEAQVKGHGQWRILAPGR